MGVLNRRFEELAPKINEANILAKKVELGPLINDQNSLVHSSLRLLSPLCEPSTFIRSYTETYQQSNNTSYSYTYEIWAGEFIREKNAEIKKAIGSSVSETHIIQFLRKYGDEIKPKIRSKVKESFSTIVDCSKAIKTFSSTGYNYASDTADYIFRKSLPFPKTVTQPRISSFSFKKEVVATDAKEFNLIEINCHSPEKINFINNPKRENDYLNSYNITDTVHIFAIEDYLDDIIEILKEAKATIDVILDFNKKYYDEINNAVMPYKIAEKLKPKIK